MMPEHGVEKQHLLPLLPEVRDNSIFRVFLLLLTVVELIISQLYLVARGI